MVSGKLQADRERERDGGRERDGLTLEQASQYLLVVKLHDQIFHLREISDFWQANWVSALN